MEGNHECPHRERGTNKQVVLMCSTLELFSAAYHWMEWLVTRVEITTETTDIHNCPLHCMTSPRSTDDLAHTTLKSVTTNDQRQY